MLIVPFLAAIILARRWDWEVIPAAVAVLGVFLIREPLVVLARQAVVWKEPYAETRAARRSLIFYLVPTVPAGLLLLCKLPIRVLSILGAAAAVLTAVAVWLTVLNRQRSLALQLSSTAGLTSSALMGWLAVRPTLDAAVWWLWGLEFAHSAAAVLVVHARLEARIGIRSTRESSSMRRRALAGQIVVLSGAISAAIAGRMMAAVALALSGTIHIADLRALRSPKSLQTPLRRVGQRALVVSIIYSALVVAGLWNV